MKKCMEIEKYETCQNKVRYGGDSKMLCALGTIDCFYRPNFIHFKDIHDDTIMYCGDVEGTGEFRTKAEWIKHFGHDDFREECDGQWHTASVKIAEIYLPSLIDNTSESQEMYEDWYSDVLPGCEKDPVVKEGFKRLNEILAGYPTYMEGLRVIFD